MGLEQKASNWIGWLIKGMVFFTVLGCITLLISVYFISKSFSDITKPPDQSAPANTSTSAGH
ncbi:MAG TPA: hypothetical protein V6C81_16180 [Planktothrix sp.]|jgi:hypothetical protein